MVLSLSRIPSTNPSGFSIYWETVARTLVARVARSGDTGGSGCWAAGKSGGGADCSLGTGGCGAASWASTGPNISKLVTETANKPAAIILRVARFSFVGRYILIGANA